MKRKLMLIVAMIAILACLFALSVSAVEPDATKGTVTLNDGTECALYDVNGNALVWYINSSGGYSYVRADSGAGDSVADSRFFDFLYFKKRHSVI